VFDFIVQINEKCASLDLPQDALRRHATLLFKGEALIWFRMIENSVSSWTDICEAEGRIPTDKILRNDTGQPLKISSFA
jgi:hypothetical protein